MLAHKSLVLFLCSVVLGDHEVDHIEIPLIEIIPNLIDQKYKNTVYVSGHEAAFDVIFRLRYDDVRIAGDGLDGGQDSRAGPQNAEDQAYY